ncbi:hypothetical protein TNCV_137501 [Trichonephila clavipes]|nr:hypothetical protein TNCV_137501 [Trichonephila clavipes]
MAVHENPNLIATSEMLRPISQIKNKQLSPPRSVRSSSVAPKADRSDSASSSQSETSVNAKSRSKSAQRLPTKAKSLQEVPLKLMKKITRNR